MKLVQLFKQMWKQMWCDHEWKTVDHGYTYHCPKCDHAVHAIR